MRIVIVSTPVFKIIPPGGTAGYAGLEVIAYHTAKGLAELGHEVSLVAPDGSECPGVKIIECGPEGRIDERSFYGGFPEIKEGDKVLRPAHPGYWQKLLDVDAVIDHSWCKYSYQIKAEGRMKAPILGVFHAPVPTMYQTWPPAFPGLPVVEKACPVCISEDQARHFEALKDYPPRVAYNGLDLSFYRPIEGMKRTDRFLFLARFSSIKGASIAIECCLRAGVGLDLVGDTTITQEPDYLRHCQQLAEKQSPGWDSSKGKQIVIHGGCSRGETVNWFSQAYCMLHSAFPFREPFGLSLVESMACFPANTPVQASDIQRTFSLTYTGRMLQLTTDHDMIETTPEHPFMTQRGWVAAKDLTLEDSLVRVNHERDGMDGERIGDLVQRLSSQRSGIHSEVTEQIHQFGQVKGKETWLVEGGAKTLHRGGDKNHSGSLSQKRLGRSGKDVESFAERCSQEGSVHGSAVRVRLEGFHRCGGEVYSRSLLDEGSSTHSEQNWKDGREHSIKSSAIGGGQTIEISCSVSCGHSVVGGHGVPRWFDRRGGNGQFEKGVSQEKSGSSNSNFQHFLAVGELGYEQIQIPQCQDRSTSWDFGKGLLKGEETQLLDCVFSGVPFFAVLQSTVKLSDYQKATDGIDSRVVGDSTISNKDGEDHRESGTGEEDAPFYEFARLRCIAGREVRNLSVFNLGTRSGTYEAAGYLVHNCGTPVLFSDKGACRETAGLLQLGWWGSKTPEQMTEKIRCLATESQIGEHTRKECRKIAEQFSVQRMAKRYSDLCEEAIREPW